MEKTFDEIKEACQPVIDYLKAHFNPHCTVIITNEQIKIVSHELCIPTEENQEKGVNNYERITNN